MTKESVVNQELLVTVLVIEMNVSKRLMDEDDAIEIEALGFLGKLPDDSPAAERLICSPAPPERPRALWRQLRSNSLIGQAGRATSWTDA